LSLIYRAADWLWMSENFDVSK